MLSAPSNTELYSPISLTEVCSNWLSGLCHLKNAELGMNLITRVQGTDCFVGMPSLEKIRLQSNQIEVFELTGEYT